MSSTKDIRELVEDELAFDPLVDASDISVKNINGDVALNGTVPSYPQYLEAAAAAQRVAGVKHMHNHLAVELPGTAYRDDIQLATAANNALQWDITVPPGIEAVARNGNLTLTGTVSYGSQRTAAELSVAGLTGVRNVKDEIDIDYDTADPAGVTNLVQEALDRNALILDDSDVLVDTAGNTVTLAGHVRTWAEHDAALDAAWMASGVYDVIDNLAITG
ncbi:MAG TPA: BON domain-containing protein [Trebonia sp.]|jgi:osmotically-inducible protein OsmY|nr:BON domain-containing protein [Trebonia sp.]